MMNDPNNESGYGSGLGYDSMPQGSADAQGYSTHDTYSGQSYATDAYGYGADGYGEDESKPYGAGDSPLVSDHFFNGYQQNVFEVNVGHSPYNETLSAPNPQVSRYSGVIQSEPVCYQPSFDEYEDQMQLEL